MPLTHRNFTLHPVLGRITATEAAEVRDMWTSAGVLSAPEAARRTGEVLFLIRERKSGVLAGVCTVYPAPLGETARTYWHFRMFLRPAFRGAAGLARFVLLASHRHLQESPPPFARNICGIAFVAENPTFRNPLTRIYFARQHPPWTRFGTDARGNEIFYCDFDR